MKDCARFTVAIPDAATVVPNLFVHRMLGHPWYTVTHSPSGFAVPVAFSSKYSAHKFVAAIAKLAHWECDDEAEVMTGADLRGIDNALKRCGGRKFEDRPKIYMDRDGTRITSSPADSEERR
jgi:hypothetical protein